MTKYIVGLLVGILTLGFLIFDFGFVHAAPPSVRIKDIAKIKEARENQVLGFGLVVGLRHTGDSQQTQFTRQALTNLLERVGISPTQVQINRSSTNAINNLTNVPRQQDFKSRNVAAVMATANIPPFIRSGQRIDVSVSSIGDATGLQGGTLLMTPLQGPDGKVYAVAQGSVSLGGLDVSGALRDKVVTTSGKIVQGAIVEEEIPVNLEYFLSEGQFSQRDARMRMSTSMFSIVLNEPDFTTASRIAYSIAKEGIDARAEDAGIVSVMITPQDDLVTLISRVENLLVVPDVRAKIVINEKTGTVVIGENIKISPVAVSYMSYSIQIAEEQASMPQDEFSSLPKQTAVEKPKQLSQISTGANLGDLISALNSLGATPRDLISILEAVKSAGALNAEIEII